MTLSEAFDSYAADVIAFRNQSWKTQEHHNVTLKSLITYLGDIPIADLTFINVRDWKLSMEARNLSVITIRGYLIKLRVVLGYLNTKGFEVLPPDQIPLPKRVDTIPFVLTPEQVSQLIDCAAMLRTKLIISMLYASGLRVSELCSLNISDTLKDSFTIVGKGGKSRICYMDERTRGLLRLYLRQRKDNNPALLVSPQNGLRITPAVVQDVIKRLRTQSGLDVPIHPHTFRHSYASNLMSNGIDLYQLMKLMGHSSLQTTQLYLSISDKHLAEDYQKYHSV